MKKFNSYSQIRSSTLNPSRYDELYPKLNEKLYDYTIDQYDEAIERYDKFADRSYVIQAHSYCRKLYDYGGDPNFIKQLENQALDLGHRTILLDIDGPVQYTFLFDDHFDDEAGL